MKSEKLRFDELFDRNMMIQLHDRFKEHIKQSDESKPFNSIIGNEVLTASQLLIVLTKFQQEDIQMQEKGIIEFLWANCFNIVFPQLFKKGHDFTYEEKLHLTGYTMFVNCLHDKDYPFENPHEQAMELKQVSKEFINTSFQWGIDLMVKLYDEENSVTIIEV